MTAGIDFGLALTAAIRGERHAQMVQLALEYDPHPPFDAGSPERAGSEAVAAYLRRMAALMPDRDARREALAATLGFADQ